MEFALQMFENAVTLDPNFALAWAAIANGCAHAQYWSGPGGTYMERAQSASLRAVALAPDIPEVLVSQGWILYAGGRYDDAVRLTRAAISRKRDCEGAYYLLLRSLFAGGKHAEVAALKEEAIEAAGTDYNVYIPIMNALGSLGRTDASRDVRLRLTQTLENHLREVPEDARARILLGGMYSQEHRVDDAIRETNLAMTLRPNEATVLYNAACTFANSRTPRRGDRRAAQGVGRRLPGRRVDAPRPGPRAAPRRARVRQALPRPPGELARTRRRPASSPSRSERRVRSNLTSPP
jgi:tetratricopeptide (TPR) repeat protein